MIHIILGGTSNALAIARSLFGCNGERHVIEINKKGVCVASRFVDNYCSVESSTDVLGVLCSYDVAEEKILYPTSDLWAEFISVNQSKLNAMGFLFLTLPESTMTVLLDKLLLHRKFKDIVKMPDTVLASCKERFPQNKDFIVKPRRSFFGDVAIMKGFRGDLVSDPSLVVQEKLSMDLRNHYSVSGVAMRGNIVFGEITNKVLEHPSPGGTATLVVTSKSDLVFNNKALEMAKRVVSAIDYSGVFEMEFIFHKGELWFLELNPRFWLQHEMFSLIGINISQMYMDLCLGNPLDEPCRRRDERLVWLHEGFWVSLLTNRYDFFYVIRSLFSKKKIFAHWRVYDPKPFLTYLRETVWKKKLKR